MFRLKCVFGDLFILASSSHSFLFLCCPAALVLFRVSISLGVYDLWMRAMWFPWYHSIIIFEHLFWTLYGLVFTFSVRDFYILFILWCLFCDCFRFLHLILNWIISSFPPFLIHCYRYKEWLEYCQNNLVCQISTNGSTRCICSFHLLGYLVPFIYWFRYF